MAQPGGLFITGHDPDFHAHKGANRTGAQHIIQRAVAYVTSGKANPKMLLVTDLRNPNGDESDPRLGMTDAGFTYDVAVANPTSGSGALDLATIDFTKYDVIVVASDYGGWLHQDELDILNNRKADVWSFVNNGGGFIAFAESGKRPPGTNVYTGTTKNRFGFLPFLSGFPTQNQGDTGYTLTEAGAAMGLTLQDINGNASHANFRAPAGMDVIDRNSTGDIVTLATRGQRVDANGLTPQCALACTNFIQVLNAQSVGAGAIFNAPSWLKVDGYRMAHVYVQFSQTQSNESPVDLRIQFAADANGQLGTENYVNLEANLPRQQMTNVIDVSGAGSWRGSPANISTFLVRIPVMGPYMRVAVTNRGSTSRQVSVAVYLLT